MPLPKIDQPLFDLKIPSTGKKIKYRPFTVKEEKILLIARESGELKQILSSIEQVVNNCVVGDIDVSKLATFDLEYLLLNIRGKAVNDVVEFQVPDPDDETFKIDVTFNVEDVKIARLEDQDVKIPVNDDYILFMRYPSLNEIMMLSELDPNSTEASLEIMISCIDQLVSSDGETIYRMDNFTKQEIDEFVDSLTSNAINRIQKFFESLPALRIECPFKNRDGEDKVFVIEGVQSFFI